MKNLLTVVGLPSLVAAIAVLGVAQASDAQQVQSKFSRQTSYIIAQGGSGSTITPSGSSSITPGGSATAAKLPTNYGLVRSVSGNMVEVRSLDGTSKQLSVPSNLSTSGFSRGSLIGYDTDAQGMITRLEPASVEREFSGTVSSINGDQVTLTSATGETVTTTVETATIARLSLVPGKAVRLTTYQGTWATKICCVETPAPVVPISPQPIPMPPIGGGEPPKPVPGLW